MADPKTALATFSLALGMDNVSAEENVQPAGAKPRFVRSRNTRLTKVPGMVSKAPSCVPLATELTGPCGGIIPHSKLNSSLVVLNTTSSSTGSRRVAGSSVGALQAFQEPSRPQNAFYPAQVISAGQVPGSSRTAFNCATCYRSDVGWTYFATIRSLGTNNYGIVLTVVADDGSEVVAPVVIDNDPTLDANSVDNFFGLTAHGSTVIFWTYGAGIVAAEISISADLVVSLSSFTAIYTPVSSHAYRITQLAYDADDTANVYLVCQNSASGSSAQVLRISTATRTVAASVSVAAGAVVMSASISYLSGVGVLVNICTFASNHIERELNATSLATTWTQTTASFSSITGCGWQHIDGAVTRVFAHSDVSTNEEHTFVRVRSSGGTLLGSFTLHYYTMIGQVVTQKASASSVHALITAQSNYDPDATDMYDPAAVMFLPDPSVEVFRFTKTLTTVATTQFVCAPVARIGVDVVIRYTGMLPSAAGTFISAANSVVADGDRVIVTYLAENVEEGLTQTGYAPRYVWLSFAGLQPDFATSGLGPTVISGAMPAVWDGNEITEFMTLRQPKLLGSAAGGSGAALSNGTYLFMAVVSWKDSQGDIHRSAPSNLVTLSGAAIQPILTVFSPATYRNGFSQENYSVTIYASETNGTTVYAQEYLCTAGVAGDTGFVWSFQTVTQPIADAFHPAIYTDGSATQPLAAYCPNACLDAEVVADRLWMLDAERTNRWWFSKPKETGVFFEMCPDLFIDVPANAGAGVATTHLNDRPMFLCQRGIWTVAGEGPDALLNPPDFSAPTQISDIACTQRSSVVRTPVGLLFVSGNRFVLFNGAAGKTFDDINATLHGNVIGTAVFRDHHEAVFFLADGYCYVFNWLEGVFTEWDTTVTGLSEITGVAQVPASDKVLLFGIGEIWLMDPNTVSETAHIDILTGFMTFGGPQDDQVIANILVQAKRASAHGITVKTATDYRGTVDATKTYPIADITASVDDTTTSKRYVVLAEPPVQPARAVQIQITETDAEGEAFQPISCTVEIRKNQGKLMLPVRRAARK